ncbi:MAG TPA: hypothetical protein VMU87_16045 [Stellaceae bacterium]|nr:hypothetical protein [Stellaceae bacterium]
MAVAVLAGALFRCGIFRTWGQIGSTPTTPGGYEITNGATNGHDMAGRCDKLFGNGTGVGRETDGLIYTQQKGRAAFSGSSPSISSSTPGSSHSGSCRDGILRVLPSAPRRFSTGDFSPVDFRAFRTVLSSTPILSAISRGSAQGASGVPPPLECTAQIQRYSRSKRVRSPARQDAIATLRVLAAGAADALPRTPFSLPPD